MNGEGSVHIDRGRWLYRLTLDTGSIAIYRTERAGQSLAPAEVWRCLAALGVTDAFVVSVDGGFQPFIELSDTREQWALERRASREDAEPRPSSVLGFHAGHVGCLFELSRDPPDALLEKIEQLISNRPS